VGIGGVNFTDDLFEEMQSAAAVGLVWNGRASYGRYQIGFLETLALEEKGLR